MLTICGSILGNPALGTPLLLVGPKPPPLEFGFWYPARGDGRFRRRIKLLCPLSSPRDGVDRCQRQNYRRRGMSTVENGEGREVEVEVGAGPDL